MRKIFQKIPSSPGGEGINLRNQFAKPGRTIPAEMANIRNQFATQPTKPMQTRNVEVSQGLPLYVPNPNPMTGAGGIRMKGYSTNAINGKQNYSIFQPGNMSRLAGINLYSDTPLTSETVTLLVNSDTVLDNIVAKEISPIDHPTNGMVFFPIDRAIGGRDEIIFTVQANAANVINIVLYYYP